MYLNIIVKYIYCDLEDFSLAVMKTCNEFENNISGVMLLKYIKPMLKVYL